MMAAQDTCFEKKRFLNCRGRLIDLSTPRVMGILNITPDSFYAGSRVTGEQAVQAARRMADEGAAFLDLGAQSTRPGAAPLPAEEEWQRLSPVLTAVRKALPDIVLSVDTFNATVADRALREGADLVNDVSGGTWDAELHPTVARHGAPCVLMHAQGRPAEMQKNPAYEDVTGEVIQFLAARLAAMRELGIADVILDPGFGFGKSLQHNFTLLRNLNEFRMLGCPVMAGLSRKSMVGKTLGVTAEQSLNGSTVLHTLALIKGVDILRVHDVKEAVEVIKIVNALNNS